MSHKSKLLIGAHTSAAGGVQNALFQGKEIGATTIQLFTANQKRWEGKPLEGSTVAAWNEALSETHLEMIMSHDSYLINLGSPDPEILAKSRHAFKEELKRCHTLGITFLNFHPGAAIQDSAEVCLDRISESLLDMEPLINQGLTILLLETTAGQGSSVGYRFEQLARIIKLVEKKIPIGVCIDTCHIFAAGYDIRTSSGWEATLDQFDKAIGLKYLRAFHLNDSAKGLGSRVDRHQHLGDGQIGWEAFHFLVKNKLTSHLPMYLETPEGPKRWKTEIATLKAIAES